MIVEQFENAFEQKGQFMRIDRFFEAREQVLADDLAMVGMKTL